MVFTKDEQISSLPVSADTSAAARRGYKSAKKLFGHVNLPGGVHATPMETVIDIIRLIDIKDNEKCWDIGCGELRLACAFGSAANNVHILCTDLSSKGRNNSELLIVTFSRKNQ